MTRSSPSSAFRRLDLPTFGRPRIATRTASSVASGGALPRSSSSATSRSRRSPVPYPWRADIATGSPRPSRWNSSAPRSDAGLSSLLASTTTGFRERLRMSAISSSPGVTPVLLSTTKRTRSALSTPCLAWMATCWVSGELSAMSTPPVSTSRSRLPLHSQTISLRSRVTPGVSKTTAERVADRRFTSVDFPTFGKPTTATVPRSGGTCTAGPCAGSSPPASSLSDSARPPRGRRGLMSGPSREGADGEGAPRGGARERACRRGTPRAAVSRS